jgi:hypothetical protein
MDWIGTYSKRVGRRRGREGFDASSPGGGETGLVGKLDHRETGKQHGGRRGHNRLGKEERADGNGNLGEGISLPDQCQSNHGNLHIHSN